MNKDRFVLLIVLAELIATTVFHICRYQADQVMGKSGIGDYKSFRYWSSWTGFAFYTFVALWVTSIAIVVTGVLREKISPKLSFTGLSAFAAGGIPALFVMSYFLALILG